MKTKGLPENEWVELRPKHTAKLAKLLIGVFKAYLEDEQDREKAERARQKEKQDA